MRINKLAVPLGIAIVAALSLAPAPSTASDGAACHFDPVKFKTERDGEFAAYASRHCKPGQVIIGIQNYLEAGGVHDMMELTARICDFSKSIVNDPRTKFGEITCVVK